MKKTAKITAAALLLVSLGGCGAPHTGTPGLVTEEVTSDPNATRVTAPVLSDTGEDDVNVRDETAYIPPETTAPVTTAPVTTAPVTPQKPEETRITFLATGDNIIHTNVYTDAKNRAKSGETYNFADMYAGIADLVADADIAMINQETPICGDKLGIYGYPNFNTPEAMGDTLIDLGFDVVNIANNHMLDRKAAGYQGTLDYWSDKDILMIGGYQNKKDYENIRIIEEQGVKIALLSYTYGTNGMVLPSTSELYVPYINQNEIESMIKKADELADLVFVVMHWGDEVAGSVTADQKKQAQYITEAGADVIIGMHPHVIQPMEWKKASDGSETLVIYSLGNLMSSQLDNKNLVGGIVTFDIVKNKAGKLSIENPIFNPTVTHYNKQRYGLQVYMLEDYTAELAALHGTPVQCNAPVSINGVWTMDRIEKFVTDAITSDFLPDFMK